MLTRRALNVMLENIVEDMFSLDIKPEKIILFGSYSKGGIHTYSDVDLAVWSKKFTGEGLIDFEIVRPLIKNIKIWTSKCIHPVPPVKILIRLLKLLKKQEKSSNKHQRKNGRNYLNQIILFFRSIA